MDSLVVFVEVDDPDTVPTALVNAASSEIGTFGEFRRGRPRWLPKNAED
jgi:hypothetical protein